MECGQPGVGVRADVDPPGVRGDVVHPVRGDLPQVLVDEVVDQHLPSATATTRVIGQYTAGPGITEPHARSGSVGRPTAAIPDSAVPPAQPFPVTTLATWPPTHNAAAIAAATPTSAPITASRPVPHGSRV